MTLLIGRSAEVALVSARLQRPEVRLLTLTGPGGTGKTRLAQQVARELLDAYPDGVFFVELAPIRDPAFVATTIAETLGVSESAGQPLHASVGEYLRDKQALLVLDNFEQVVDAAPTVAKVLAAARRVKVLATSREVLRVHGEQVVRVPPLPAANPKNLPVDEAQLVETLQQYEAAQLFMELAQAADVGFELTAENARAVAEICYRLDGLPLAIELAAARARLLPPRAMLARLNRPLQLLTGGARDLPFRQQTLRATIDWSYTLLSPGEQQLFRRLGVFVGGFAVDAAEAVAGADGSMAETELTEAFAAPPAWHEPPIMVLDGLQSLVDKSLLRQQASPDDEPRFMMLETIHEYALEQLAASREEDMLRSRHAEYYLQLAETAEPEQAGPQEGEWIARLAADHDNLRAALAWSRTPRGDPELGLCLAGALWWWWFGRGHFSEARTWLEAVLATPIDASPGRRTARAKALIAAGMLLSRLGQYARANALFAESAELYQKAGDRAGAAHALLYRGRTAVIQGEYEHARRLEEESLALFRELGEKRLVAWTLLSLGDVALDQGDLLQAGPRFQEALALCRERGDKTGAGWALVNLGIMAGAEGDNVRATTRYEEAMALFRELGDTTAQAAVRAHLGRAAHARGDEACALQLLGESLAWYRQNEDSLDVSTCLAAMAGVAGALGQPARAAGLFGAAEALREALHAPLAPIARADYERDVAAARAQVDGPTWKAAWAEGRAMTMEQAVTEAEQIAVSGAEQIAVSGEDPAPTPVAPAAIPQPALQVSAADPPAGLTEREVEVLRLVARGLTNREVGERLFISPHTVNMHLRSIFGKLEVSTRAEATRFAVERRLV